MRWLRKVRTFMRFDHFRGRFKNYCQQFTVISYLYIYLFKNERRKEIFKHFVGR